MNRLSRGLSAALLVPCLGPGGAARAAPQASPISPNANGALVGPTVANVLQPATVPRQTISGPFTPVSKLLGRYGISLRGVLIDQYANNPVGGVGQGSDNVGQLNFGADVDLQKLVGIPGGSFHVTVYRDYGNGLAKDTSGTFVKQQNIYKNPYNRLHLGLVAYEQKLFDNTLDIVGGRLGTTTFYGHLVPACSFQGGATCGVPAVLNSEAGFSLLPSATWGTNVTVNLAHDVYVETGAFEVNPTTSATNGLYWSTEAATGVTVPFELAWARASLRGYRYPFELKLGGYLSTADHADPFYNTKNQSLGLHGGTAKNDTHRSGVYLMGDKVVWRPTRRGSENLNLFGGIIQAADPEEIATTEVYAGMVLSGAIRGRPRDSIGLTGSFFRISPREIEYLRDARHAAGGSGVNDPNEGVFELNYGWQVIQNLRLTPNVQYIVNPDNSSIPKTRILPKNVLAFGMYLNFSFSTLLGFAGTGPAAD